MNDFTVCSVYTDLSIANKHLIPSISVEDVAHLVMKKGHSETNLSHEYNVMAHTINTQYVIFCHPDVEFSPEVFQTIRDTLNEEVAVVGLVGVVGPNSPVDIVSASAIHSPTDAVTLDSCFIALESGSGEFDSRGFAGLHLCVEDMCCCARSVGRKCQIIPANVFRHHSVTYSKNPKLSWGAYPMYKERLIRKWSGAVDVFTT